YISVNLNNVSLEEAFSRIVAKTEINFQYDKRLVANKKIKKNFSNASLGELLRYISNETGLSFRRVNETIYVIDKPVRSVEEELSQASSMAPLLDLRPVEDSRRNQHLVRLENALTTIQSTIAQTVRGTVVDDNGEALPGVSILEKGTTNGTTTDTDGRFTITVAGPESVLTFSFIGFSTQEITVGNQENLSVTMITEDRSLEEIVVVGYGTQKKVNLTGSVAAVTFDEKIASRSLANVSSSLSGLVPGMAVTQNTGMAGSNGASLIIRGLGTVNNASPLIEVGGMTDVDINRINMHDIESISVLKDATSASVCGSRAANGVILITTKSGKGQDRASINYTGSYAVQKPTNVYGYMPDYPRALTLHQRAALVNTLRSNLLFRDGTIDQWMALGMIDPVRYPNTDWWDIIVRNGSVQTHNLSASGGNDKSNFFISVGVMDEKGLQINNDFSRYNARFNYDYKINKTMNVGVKFQGNWSKHVYALEDGFTDDNSSNTAGFDMQYAIAGILPYDPVTGYFGGVMAYSEDPQAYNPYTLYINSLNRSNRQEANSNIYWDWPPIKGLTARIDYSLNYFNQFRWQANMPNRAYNFQTEPFGCRIYVGENSVVANYTNNSYKTMSSGRLDYYTTIKGLTALLDYSLNYFNQFRWQANMPKRAYNIQTETFGSRVYVGENAGVANYTNTGYKTMLTGRLNYNTTIAKNHEIGAMFV